MTITDMKMVDKNTFHIKAVGEWEGKEVLMDIPRFFVDMSTLEYEKETQTFYCTKGGKRRLAYEEILSENCDIKTEVLATNGGFWSIVALDE